MEINFKDFDGSLYYGEIRKLDIVLNNIGYSAIKKINLRFIDKFYFGIDSIDIDQVIEPNQTAIVSVFIKAGTQNAFETKLIAQYFTEQSIRYSRFILKV